MTDMIGFIGVGTMGEPMCRNLAKKSGMTVLAADRDPAPLKRLEADGVKTASLDEIATTCRTIFLSLPGGKEVEQVCLGEGGLVSKAKLGWTVIDLSTAPPRLAQQLYEEFEGRASAFADAPVARTRQAAIDGTLSIMVGATPPCFARIEPLLRHMASEVTHCGAAGAGQTVKILNNMILFQTVVALGEALAIARAQGVDGKVLFETLTKGSADSFALRNHGMKAMLPGVFPERAFSSEYALKDLGYAIEMAEAHGVPALGADVARELMERAVELGHGKEYWPVLLKAIEDATGKG
ncbi:MAG: NAD(P)-dependent oxidoreductase [Reyranella sp.]|uniref:NAD(P)-dependent oxidoreductase n=1 Tax=Reyranella sp. TaxID=1929291 RepID=UPI00121DE225|nr:NAD(P)-dependent oxidoreductase [Reyranella sp.]TAJ38023.1 MAG: NAD(P)-dependent oxidoreductase [Reyranella sp.]